GSTMDALEYVMPMATREPHQACLIRHVTAEKGHRLEETLATCTADGLCEDMLTLSLPSAGPVQPVRPRVAPGCRPHQRAGAARGVARQRPGCSGAGGGACGGGRGRRGGVKSAFNFLSAPAASKGGPGLSAFSIPLQFVSRRECQCQRG